MMPRQLAAGLAIAIACGALATWGVRAFALAYGIVNHPNPLVPQHRKPIAYLGGVGVFLGAACAIVASMFLKPWGLWPAETGVSVRMDVAIPAVLFLALGVMDDLVVLSPSRKFAGQVALALLAVAMGLYYPATGIRWIDAPVSCFWILALVNAFNLTDVCDGLVGGLSVVSLLFIGFLVPGQLSLAVVLAGACVGFLVFNFPPASIFLGDAGSHLLGFLVAALTLLAPQDATCWPYPIQMILLAGVPLFELGFLIIIRMRKGLPWWKGSPDHFALRLQAAGLTRLQTDLIAWSAAALLCGAAATLNAAPIGRQVGVLVTVLTLLAVAWKLLLRWEVKPRKPATVPVAEVGTFA